jgi:hypothetical protein
MCTLWLRDVSLFYVRQVGVRLRVTAVHCRAVRGAPPLVGVAHGVAASVFFLLFRVLCSALPCPIHSPFPAILSSVTDPTFIAYF